LNEVNHPVLIFVHAQALLAKNAKVYIAARSEDRVKAAVEDLKQTTGNEAIWLKLDLSELKSIKVAAEEFLGWVGCLRAVNVQLILPLGKNQNSTSFSTTRAFRSLASKVELNLPSNTVVLCGRRWRNLLLTGMTWPGVPMLSVRKPLLLMKGHPF